ncbi:MAG: AIPR family protein [Nitrososphaerales archaeon]
MDEPAKYVPMFYQSYDQLIRKLQVKTPAEATKELTRFFVNARFGIKGEDFDRRFVDGKDDGGIDFYNCEDGTFYIIQTKFSSSSQKAQLDSILREIKKINNTLIGQNPNRRADEFVNALKRELYVKNSLLEIIWLTTEVIEKNVAKEVQKELDNLRKSNNWSIDLDFVPFDRYSLERMIFDVEHGYIPYTGRKSIQIMGGKYIINEGDKTGVYSIVCSVRIVDMLRWLKTSDDVKIYLQKNVRDYKGDNEINNAIRKSYLEAPEWFWYKHNGIIVFADSISVTSDGTNLVMRNPQIVNGGQTLRTLFTAYNTHGQKDSDAQVLLRVYRLPYESSETYKNSIEIISALNTQNMIRPSDLHSTDPVQVRIQKLMEEMDYKYYRKSGKEFKTSRWSITMRNLALYYYVCKNKAPHEGVKGQVEELFKDRNKYDDIFPEQKINQELTSKNHIVLDYIVVWILTEIIKDVKGQLPKQYKDLAPYTRYYVLSDVYNKLEAWKKNFDQPGWRNWKEFVESKELYNELRDYIKQVFKIATIMIPRNELANPRKFLIRKEATSRFETKTPSQNKFNNKANRAYKKWEKSRS